jgi:hypothetical protein
MGLLESMVSAEKYDGNFFASNTLACLTVIHTQEIASNISSYLKLIRLIALHTIIPLLSTKLQ